MRRHLPVGLLGLLGLAKGLAIGIALALVATRGLGSNTPGALISVLLAGGAGFLVGLVAGRPIWERDAKTEALLKAIVGALIGAGSSFALRRWLSLPVDLSVLGLGIGAAGTLAAVSLPLISTGLALFFELDNNSGSEPKPRASAPTARQRLQASKDSNGQLSDLDLAAPDEPPAEREREREKR